jgi:hypothetical protein
MGEEIKSCKREGIERVEREETEREGVERRKRERQDREVNQ